MAALSRTYWLTQPCRIRRTNQSVTIERGGQETVHIPVTDIRDIIAADHIDINTSAVSLLKRHSIPIHILDYYGNYTGSVFPAQQHNSGTVVIAQVNFAQKAELRSKISKPILLAAAHNMNVAMDRPEMFQPHLKNFQEAIENTTDNDTMMGHEGNLAKHMWKHYDTLLPEWAQLGGRRRRPPPNPGNSLVSYLNGIVYAQCLTAIRLTALYSGIGFLHANARRHRHTLALDLAEIYKPIVTLRTVKRLTNKKQLTPKSFQTKLNSTLLNDKGRKTLLADVREQLENKHENPSAKRPTSLQEMMYLDALKIVRTLIEPEEPYMPTKVWW